MLKFKKSGSSEISKLVNKVAINSYMSVLVNETSSKEDKLKAVESINKILGDDIGYKESDLELAFKQGQLSGTIQNLLIMLTSLGCGLLVSKFILKK